jgi:hypothetical protein
VVGEEEVVADWTPVLLLLDKVSEVEDESLLLETVVLGGGEKLS